MHRWLSGAPILWAATQANASEQLSCRFPSTEDGGLFETLQIDVSKDGSSGHLRFCHRGTGARAREINPDTGTVPHAPRQDR
jgi:hypothetical protein